MEIKVCTENRPFESSLTKLLKSIVSVNYPHIVFIDMSMKDSRDLAEEKARKTENLVIALTFDRSFDDDLKYYGWLLKFLSRSNTRNVFIPFFLKDIIHECCTRKPENPALYAVGKFVSQAKKQKKTVSILNHNFKYNQEEVAEKARNELGWEGTTREIGEKLREAAEELRKKERPMEDFVASESEGYYPGVFCDVEGTLLDPETDCLNMELLKKLERISKEKPVTIWTGGDFEEITKELVGRGINKIVISKNWLTGSKVETVIDDMNESDFEEVYGIQAENFFQAESGKVPNL